MANCVFCDIVEGKIPAKLAHEDHLAVAFLDHKGVRPPINFCLREVVGTYFWPFTHHHNVPSFSGARRS